MVGHLFTGDFVRFRASLFLLYGSRMPITILLAQEFPAISAEGKTQKKWVCNAKVPSTKMVANHFGTFSCCLGF